MLDERSEREGLQQSRNSRDLDGLLPAPTSDYLDCKWSIAGLDRMVVVLVEILVGRGRGSRGEKRERREYGVKSVVV